MYKRQGEYTTVVPVELPDTTLVPELRQDHVQITADLPGASFGAEIFTWVILLAPFIIVFWLWRRLSKGAVGQLQGCLLYTSRCV